MPSPSAAPPTDPGAWNRAARGRLGAGPFHLWEWGAIYQGSLGLSAHPLSVGTAGEPAAILPLFRMRTLAGRRVLISVPFASTAGLAGDDPAAESALLEAARQTAIDTHCETIELRHGDREPAGWVIRRHKVRETLPLPDQADTLWQGFPAKLRSQIRKAWKSGLTESRGGLEWLAAFHAVYAHNMRALGSPPLPRRFFAELLAAFPDLATIHVVRLGERVVAAGLTLGLNGAREVPWAASLDRYRALAPVMLLYWDMIRHATALGERVFDMGRSTPGSGPHRFKQQWGTQTRTLNWAYWLAPGVSPPSATEGGGRLTRLIRRGWRHLPLPIATRLGGWLIRHIPA